MNPISERTYEAVKNLSASAIAKELGIEQAGERNKYSCPHRDCEGSDELHVYSELGRGAYCYACGRGFDTIELVKAVEGVDDAEAVEWLCHRSDIPIGYVEEPPVHRTKVNEPKRGEESQRHSQAVTRAFFSSFELGEQAHAYLTELKIDAERAANVYGVRSIESTNQWNAVAERFSPQDLGRIGLDGFEQALDECYPILLLPFTGESGERLYQLRQTGVAPMNPIYHPKLRHLRPFLEPNVDLALDHPTNRRLIVCADPLDALAVATLDQPVVSGPGSCYWNAEWVDGWQGLEMLVVLASGDAIGRRFSQEVKRACHTRLGDGWVARHLQVFCLPDRTTPSDFLVEGTLHAQLKVIDKGVWLALAPE